MERACQRPLHWVPGIVLGVLEVLLVAGILDWTCTELQPLLLDWSGSFCLIPDLFDNGLMGH